MRYPSMWPKRTKAAHEYYKRVEREYAEKLAEREVAEATARRFLLLQDRSFLPMRQEGEQAFAEGKLRRDNPYEVLSGAFVNWDVGYRDCQNRNS